MKIYVSASAYRDGDGTQARPFKHINDAAKVARPGDEVLVAPGVYREYVDPQNAGTEDARITYRSTEPLGAWPTPFLGTTTPTPPTSTATGTSRASPSTPAACT